MQNLYLHLLWLLDKVTVPGWADIRQTRGYHTFYWIREGKGIFRTEEQEMLQVCEGMLFYLRPGLQLSMETDTQQPLRLTMVLLSVYQVPTAVLPGSIIMEPVEMLPLPFLTRTEGETASSYDILFAKLIQNWHPGQVESELPAKSLLYELIYRVFRQSHMVPAGENTGKQLFLRIKDDLDRRYAESIRLKDWATNYNISESYLRAIFTRYAGQSPKSYLSSLRCEHAKRQLAFTNRTMKDIADSCGYVDEFHFSKSFKKACGMPPKKWRLASIQGDENRGDE